MELRKAQSGDEPEVFALAREFATSFKVEQAAFHTSFQSILEDQNAILLVASENDRIVGYCLGFIHNTLFANGRVAWVEEIMVEATERRKGIGLRLMTEFENWAQGRSAKLVALATRRASEFYESLDYEASATYFRKLL